MDARQPRVGTAGWSIRTEYREDFPLEGSQLERYAARFNAVEINSSFYRPHRRATYERWAGAVGDDFRFSVKLPKTVSHAGHSDEIGPLAARFAEEVAGLGDRLGAVLIQFPPSLAFDLNRALRLFTLVGDILPCPLVCEPRHASWFADDADAMMDRLGIARVAADPAIVPSAGRPGGWPGLHYQRLHGSPKAYYSNYEPDALEATRAKLATDTSHRIETWCILDNTALGFATANALSLRAALDRKPEERSHRPRIERR